MTASADRTKFSCQRNSSSSFLEQGLKHVSNILAILANVHLSILESLLNTCFATVHDHLCIHHKTRLLPADSRQELPRSTTGKFFAPASGRVICQFVVRRDVTDLHLEVIASASTIINSRLTHRPRQRIKHGMGCLWRAVVTFTFSVTPTTTLMRNM